MWEWLVVRFEFGVELGLRLGLGIGVDKMTMFDGAKKQKRHKEYNDVAPTDEYFSDAAANAAWWALDATWAPSSGPSHQI